MAKSLELLFVTQEGNIATISVDNPKEPVDLSKSKRRNDSDYFGQCVYNKIG